jgi:hypothetical protein
MIEESLFNPNRQLCPDGSCVGVLGADGLCNVCQRSKAAIAEADADAAEPVETGSASDFDSARRLCDDGSCVGVVGPDGACGTCGRKAE